MNPVQESKQELEAAIRYAENAISSAKQTIESVATYQEQTGREAVLESELAGSRELLDAMTDENIELEERNDKLNAQIVEQTEREAELERELQRQKDLGQGYYDSMMIFKEKADSLSATIQRLKEDQPTMPVIPKAVAIAIFREGVQAGVVDAISELEGQTINVCENEYCGDFEVTFARDVRLDDELDFDWLRDNVGQFSEKFVVGALKGLCALKEFECRIHGVDDQGDDSKGA